MLYIAYSFSRCAICNTTFENVDLIRDHINSHLQGLPHQCRKCDYSFETEKQLVRHELKHAEMEYEEQIEKEVCRGPSQIKQNKVVLCFALKFQNFAV